MDDVRGQTTEETFPVGQADNPGFRFPNNSPKLFRWEPAITNQSKTRERERNIYNLILNRAGKEAATSLNNFPDPVLREQP